MKTRRATPAANNILLLIVVGFNLPNRLPMDMTSSPSNKSVGENVYPLLIMTNPYGNGVDAVFVQGMKGLIRLIGHLPLRLVDQFLHPRRTSFLSEPRNDAPTVFFACGGEIISTGTVGS